MFDNSSPYTLRATTDGSVTHYFVSYVDEDGSRQEAEVSLDVYNEFLSFIKLERNLRRCDERHLEQSWLSDAGLYNRAFNPPQSVEDEVIDGIINETLHHAILQLPKKQRRRFVLYYDFGLKYSQIAKIEGCDRTAVKYTVDKAKIHIAKMLKEFFD